MISLNFLFINLFPLLINFHEISHWFMIKSWGRTFTWIKLILVPKLKIIRKILAANAFKVKYATHDDYQRLLKFIRCFKKEYEKQS